MQSHAGRRDGVWYWVAICKADMYRAAASVSAFNGSLFGV